jgi:hypothetical protein
MDSMWLSSNKLKSQIEQNSDPSMSNRKQLLPESLWLRHWDFLHSWVSSLAGIWFTISLSLSLSLSLWVYVCTCIWTYAGMQNTHTSYWYIGSFHCLGEPWLIHQTYQNSHKLTHVDSASVSFFHSTMFSSFVSVTWKELPVFLVNNFNFEIKYQLCFTFHTDCRLP